MDCGRMARRVVYEQIQIVSGLIFEFSSDTDFTVYAD
jgi:hypothetical protein